jgi:hypothetical protein
VFADREEIRIGEEAPLMLSVQFVLSEEYWYLVMEAEPVTETGMEILLAVTVTVPRVGTGGRVVPGVEVGTLLPPAFTVRRYAVYAVFAEREEIRIGEEEMVQLHHAEVVFNAYWYPVV